MGGLSHYLEDEGIATTQISLIKEHSQKMRPPRALWVTFPLGRPLGNPNDPEFQRDVLSQALNLLEEAEGPVLFDYPEDADDDQAGPAIPACPVDFSSRNQELTDTERLLQKFESEFNSLHTWHTIACEQKGRTASGVSGLSFEELSTLYADFITGKADGLVKFEANLADKLRLAAEDLKSCYFETLSARPGQPTDAASLADWFWGDTYAAAVINEVRKKCLEQGTKEMSITGKLLLIPRNQLHRFEV
ncbi:MAG: hypothetical protein ACR2PB_08000 [Desulfocapsaceae bacterium]